MGANALLDPVPRYRFAEFVLSPRRRLLLRHGREQPLIPRYFDLLVFLVERRHEAVHRRDIFDGVWSDVVVSDSALSQAIRTIRRVLQDDSREPRFIRTVSRHGYCFVCTDVVEEDDEGGWLGAGAAVADPVATRTDTPSFESLLDRLTQPSDAGSEEDRREAAELLHALGTSEALQRLGTSPGHAEARALLRDTRWDIPDAGAVPILGEPAPLATAWALVQLRLRRAASVIAARWAAAAAGGGLAGLLGGAAGGLILIAVPEAVASAAVIPVLAAVGACCGAAGGAGVGAGLALSESVMRSRRAPVLIAGAALGGGLAGSAAQWLGRWSLAALVGVRIETGGALEGLVIGGAAGLGYVLATSHIEGGLAAPRGRRRLGAAGLVAAACGLAGLALALTGRPLVGGTLHLIALTSLDAEATLTALARLLGEPDFGRLTGALIATGEAALFGFGLALGLTRRPSKGSGRISESDRSS